MTYTPLLPASPLILQKKSGDLQGAAVCMHVYILVSSITGFRLWKPALSLDLPDIVGFQQFGEVMILLLGAHLLQLSIDSIVVGGSLHIAENAEGNGESLLGRHQCEFQLEGIVLTVGIVNEH